MPKGDLSNHTPTCACPICRSRRGERVKVKLVLQVCLGGEEADLFRQEAACGGLTPNALAKAIIREWLKKPWR